MKNGIGCISMLNLLSIVFVVCKLLNIINWSWIKCFIPTFIVCGIYTILLIIIFISKMIED